MQINLFDQHNMGQLIIQCWLKTLSLPQKIKMMLKAENSAATVRTSQE